MDTSLAARALAFRQLHADPGCFVIPNPWDVGSARLLAGMGFKALASTGAGHAFSCGLTDGAVGREGMLAHLRQMADATDLPLSADLENGFGHAPETVAETIRLAATTGIVGGSIEDSSGDRDAPILPLDLAAERVRAAVEAARALPFPFTLTARAENHFLGQPDLADTIRRLQAYQEAGADVLFAPGLRTREDIAAVLSAVDRPVNVLMGMEGVTLTVADLAALGVKRISVGGSFARAAYGAFLRAAREVQAHGSFSYANEAISGRDITRLLRSPRG
ncbi:oxaloacetate decarboxylase [Zoogloea sp.]|uniref:isocitrate lyase/PEP mutase family protein n=1 Tax=Zoogloea sp. TaxID=49181 RepID=UPI0025CC7D70|nr:isocitrate lyase/phosphoenolpyruvate mutase family protein [Zoogloea sp.]MCK6394767.1 isocitrate lyase/phosphoenolpyruvate mutase family protein [Zoogloea sp.]